MTPQPLTPCRRLPTDQGYRAGIAVPARVADRSREPELVVLLLDGLTARIGKARDHMAAGATDAAVGLLTSTHDMIFELELSAGASVSRDEAESLTRRCIECSALLLAAQLHESPADLDAALGALKRLRSTYVARARIVASGVPPHLRVA